MKFGLFYELQLPKGRRGRDWDPGAEKRIYRRDAGAGDARGSLGFDYVFEVEHHFLEEYSLLHA